jgi:hypothetical protein
MADAAGTSGAPLHSHFDIHSHNDWFGYEDSKHFVVAESHIHRFL